MLIIIIHQRKYSSQLPDIGSAHVADIHASSLRWLKTVFNTYIWIGRYNHCLSFYATIMVSKKCPIIGEHVVIIFLTQ